MRNVWRIFGRDELRVKFLAWNMKAAFFAVDRGAACESGRKVAIIFRRNIVAVVNVVEVVGGDGGGTRQSCDKLRLKPLHMSAEPASSLIRALMWDHDDTQKVTDAFS